MTAEFAVAIPAVLLVLALMVGVVASLRNDALVSTLAMQAARALGRGESETDVRARIAESARSARVVVTRPDADHVCVSIQSSSRGLAIPHREERACVRLDM